MLLLKEDCEPGALSPAEDDEEKRLETGETVINAARANLMNSMKKARRL